MSATPVAAVYVHAPFCARRCVYCDFAVKVRAEGGPESWWEALRGELDHVAREGLFELRPELSSLYVGGGTPSLLGPDAMRGLAALLGPERLRGEALEWTAEANPESLGPDVAAGWARAGVNRLSLGVQTFHEPALRWMGRLHGTEGGGRAVAIARGAGISELSVDLIFALPGHLGRSWTDDLARALALDVPHVSLYGLGIEPGTALGRAVAEGRESPVDEDRYADEFLEAAETLTGAGYVHYEVSNFARPGHEARHNTTYWTGDPYLGLGNGAHSYAHPIRRWNVRDWDEYARRAAAAVAPEEEREEVDAEALELERAWLGLRTRRGIPRPPEGSARALRVASWVRKGLAIIEQGGAGGGASGAEGAVGPDGAGASERVVLTAEGWLLLDRLAVEYTG